MSKKILSIFLSLTMLLSSVSGIVFASDDVSIDVTSTINLTDGCFTRKGSGNGGDGIVAQGNGMYVLDSSTSNNYRVAFLKFDMSGTSFEELENCDDISLVLNDLQGDNLPSGGAYDITVSVLDENQNEWSSSELTYYLANENAMFSTGTEIASKSESLGDTGEEVRVSLNKDTFNSLVSASTSKVLTLRVVSNNGVWVFSGGVSDVKSPKLTITTGVSVADEMQIVYDNLDFTDISSDTESSVTSNLDFSVTENLPYGIVVDWSSSSDGVVTSEGVVSQPITNYGGTDASVTITATIHHPDYPSVTPLVKTFNIIVPARSLTNQEIADNAKIELTNTVALIDGCFTRKGGGNSGDGIVVQGNGSYVLDSNTANNFRAAFLKFDLSGISLSEIENASDISLVVNDLRGDALPSGGSYNVSVTVLEESKNNWDSSTLTYQIANTNSMYSGGTSLASASASLADTGAQVKITLDKDALADVLEASSSKVITLKLVSTSGVWVLSGGVSGEKSPKLSITSEVSIAAEMQSVYDNLDFSDISSDLENSVVNNLDFSVTSNLPYGIVADWTSTNEEVVSLDGVVTQPVSNLGGIDTPVTLEVTISHPDFPELPSLTKIFNIIVPARSLTDAEFVADEVLALTFDKIKGFNESSDAVTTDLDFTYQGIYDGTTITYVPSPDTNISLDGTVRRPSFTQSDAPVAITATITHGDVTDTVVINVVVLNQDITDDVLVTKELYATDISNISKNNKDEVSTRLEPVIDGVGHHRFTFLRYDLGELNDEEIQGLDSSIFRVYATNEVALTNHNYTISIVNDNLEQYLEANRGALTYNILSANGLLENSATTLIYASGNVIESNVTYESSDILDALKSNLEGSSNKIVWLKINTTKGAAVLGSIADSNVLRRPTIVAKHIMVEAERDIRPIEVPKVLTSNITLPTVGENGTPIVWSTSNPLVVTSDGVINRYNIGENYTLEDTAATLTASTQNAWDTFTKSFDVRVKMGGVIDATSDISIGSSAGLTSDSADLLLGGTEWNLSALFFNLTDDDKANIARGRKTALKLYADAAYAGKDLTLYAVNESCLSSLTSFDSLSYNDLEQIISGNSTKIDKVIIDDKGYIVWDVSDYVRYLNNNKAGFALVTSSEEVIKLYSLDNANVLKLPKLIVSDVEYTDAYAAQAAADRIRFTDLTNDPQNALRFDLNLPTSGIFRSTITWSLSSGSSAINTTTGALNRTDADQSVTLIATVRVGSENATKSFDVVVKKSETTQQYLEYILSGISIPQKHLTSSITLPGQDILDLGFVDSIEWVSSEDYEANVNGFRLVLNRPVSADLSVNLTVKVKINGVEAQKTIGVWVLRSSSSNLLRNRQVVYGDLDASLAVDENISTAWQARRKTVVFNLNSKRIISSLTLIPYLTSIDGIKISISDDNINYTEVYNGGRFNAEELGYITFSPVIFGRYLKLELPSTSQGIRFLGAYSTSDESSMDIFQGVTVPENAGASFSLPQIIAGSSVVWTSSSQAITISGSYATVNRQKKDVNVTLTAKIIVDGIEKTKSYVVKVPGTGGSDSSSGSSSSKGGSTIITAPSVVTPSAEPQPIVPQPSTPVFSDLDSASWAKDYITTLAGKGIINGYADGTFAPNNLITREEMSKLLVVAFGIANGSGSSSFSDVDSSAWYYSYVDALVSGGHTKGIGNGLFGTGKYISRQDAFTMLASVLGLKFDSTELSTGFNDDENISPYARLAILTLKQHGIIGGDNLGNINPTTGITRAEVAKIICHSLNK